MSRPDSMVIVSHISDGSGRVNIPLSDHLEYFNDELDLLVREKGEPKDLLEAWELAEEVCHRMMHRTQSYCGLENSFSYIEYGLAVEPDEKLTYIEKVLDTGLGTGLEMQEESCDVSRRSMSNFAKIAELTKLGWWKLPAGAF